MNTQELDARREVSGGYKVDVTRGERIGRVSSEWFSRPDDERFPSLGDLAHAVRDRVERSRTRIVETNLIQVEANRADGERLALILPGADAPAVPTHWSFGQLAGQVGAPAAYLRQLPAALAGINLQYGLSTHRGEQIKTLETDDGRVELRAVTGPDYGRIYDHELVDAAQRIAGNGTGDTRWKIPGVLDWATGIYNPRIDITKDTTTLYASDRDVFLFLVDDMNPIEAGHLVAASSVIEVAVSALADTDASKYVRQSVSIRLASANCHPSLDVRQAPAGHGSMICVTGLTISPGFTTLLAGIVETCTDRSVRRTNCREHAPISGLALAAAPISLCGTMAPTFISSPRASTSGSTPAAASKTLALMEARSSTGIV